jgi:hypothetical protein
LIHWPNSIKRGADYKITKNEFKKLGEGYPFLVSRALLNKKRKTWKLFPGFLNYLIFSNSKSRRNAYVSAVRL